MALSAAMLEMLKQKKAVIASRSGEKAAKLKDGKNRLRILPSKDEGGVYWHDFGQHWIKDENQKILAVIGCSDVAYGEPCKMCELLGRAAVGVSDDDTLKVIAEAKKAPRRVLVVAQHRLSDNPDKALITELPQTVFETILNTQIEYADEFGDVLDLKAGIDFIIEKTGSGIDTSYTVTPAPKASEVKNAKAIMDDLPSLADYVKNTGQFEVGQAKAISAIATISGSLPMIGSGPSSASAGALTGPKTGAGTTKPKPAPAVIDGDAEEVETPCSMSEVIDDDLPDHSAVKPGVHAAKVTEVAAEPSASEQDDINKMLADLDL